MTIELKIASENDAEEWDKLVESSPHGTVFHTWKWLTIAEKHTNSKFYPIIGYKGTTPVGIFPLFYQRKVFLKMLFSPLPHTAIPYLGPALVGYDKIKQSRKESIFIEFLKQVEEFIFYEIIPNYISISLTPDLLDSRPFKWTGYQINPMYSYSADLSKGTEYIWSQFERNTRQQINKTKKMGISIEEGLKEDLGTLYDLLVERYREQNRVVNVPKDYLLDLYDSFHPGNMRIFVAKYDGEIITGSVFICSKDKFISWMGSPKTSLKGTYSNELVKWEGIKWAIEHGFKQFELIGAIDIRLDEHKRKYNFSPSIRFSAKKYSSFVPKWLENSYIQILKPMNAKFKLRGRK